LADPQGAMVMAQRGSTDSWSVGYLITCNGLVLMFVITSTVITTQLTTDVISLSYRVVMALTAKWLPTCDHQELLRSRQ